MGDQSENLMLVYLRRLDAKMDVLQADMAEVKHHMATLEVQVRHLVSTEASHYATIITRLDRFEQRLDRLERRADILPA